MPTAVGETNIGQHRRQRSVDMPLDQAPISDPGWEDLVDMARRTNDARGHAVKLVLTW